MAKNKLKTNGIFFTGESADNVTGSQYYIRFGQSQFLIECGLYQSSSNSYLDSYRINSKKFKFKPSELDYVFVAHAHIDHSGLIPRLIKEGFKGKIITTKETAMIMKPLLYNSCAIINEEANILSKRYKRDYNPLYDNADVDKALNAIEIYDDYNTIYKLNDNIEFQWLKNSHCIGAAQLQLILKDNNRTKKILYTSDLGSLNSQNHYVSNTEIMDSYNDISIMEGTYGDENRKIQKSRKKDMMSLETAINTTIERNGTVIMPCFSFSRTQEIITSLYEIYHDKEINFPIIVDSKLSCDICNLYGKLLNKEDLDLWNKVFNGNCMHFVSDKEVSRKIIEDTTPKVIISSSGFCTNGRVVGYLKKYLKDKRNMIIFTGYSGDNPSYLSYKIKNYKKYTYISINKEKIRNLADCISLSSFSSHANRNDLIKFGSSLNTNQIVIVHADRLSKLSLVKGLKEAVSLNNKTFKVTASEKDMIIPL